MRGVFLRAESLALVSFLHLTLACSSKSVNEAAAGGTSAAGGAAGSVGACADGSDDQVYTGNAMVGCDGLATQCDAATLCSPSWHMCTYEEYADRGGKDQPAKTLRWLKSCVREYGKTETTCPSQTACSS